jgi:preprotein translocase subunit YajC
MYFDVLAQVATQAAEQAAEQAPRNPTADTIKMFGTVGLVLLVIYFIMLRPKHKEEKQRRNMLANIKKYDKVMTIGGIIGTVMEIREDEVILKVDDNTNTRIKFSRSAIQRPLSVQDSENKDDK